jgi:hypothetical protein
MHENTFYNKMNYPDKIISKFFNNIIYPGNIIDCWLWKGSHRSDGYCQFLYKHYIHAHRFIFECYNGQLNPGEQVRHKICDNKSCVNPNHLLRGTHLDNMKDRDESGLTVKGSKQWQSILIEEQVEEIILKTLNKEFISMSQVENHYHIYRSLVWDILKRNTWKHVTNKFSNEQLKKVSLILSEKPIKDNIEIIKDIKKRLANNESGRSIAKLYNVTPAMISYIKLGKYHTQV